MKRVWSVILAAVVALTPVTALAESQTGKTWNVTYNSAGKLEDDFTSAEYMDQISGLEPGDDITFTVNLSHQNSDSADWYIRNDVIKSLEDASSAEGSAYEYVLDYSGPKSRNLYSSDVVGGDEGDGLHDATDALSDDDFLYLDTLSKGDSATVTLHVALDGETEGNAYFDTLARIKLAFAVEPNPEPENKERVVRREIPRRRIVQTGDETRLFPFYVAMLVSGLLFAGLAVKSVRERKKEDEVSAR